jgi:SAM-dependent methyltransferase
MEKFTNLLIRLIPKAVKQSIIELISQIVRNQFLTLSQDKEFEAAAHQDPPPALDLSKKVEELEIALEQMESILQVEKSIPPAPPKHLQIRVVGVYVPDFIRSGVRTYQLLNDALKSVSKNLDGFKTILDFGCGCGRIIRAFRHFLPSQNLYGTDIDPEAIEWLRTNYRDIAEFAVNPHLPPMPYKEETFDFIYSISIFTHLPEEMQFAWLEELRRITKPGGYLILTTHGETYYGKLAHEKQTIIKKRGFYYNEDENIKTEGLPVFYKVSYHSHDYIRNEWGRFFDILRMFADGLDHQDIILLQKRS